MECLYKLTNLYYIIIVIIIVIILFMLSIVVCISLYIVTKQPNYILILCKPRGTWLCSSLKGKWLVIL